MFITWFAVIEVERRVFCVTAVTADQLVWLGLIDDYGRYDPPPAIAASKNSPVINSKN